MDNLNQLTVSAWADVDFEVGDAVYFQYYNEYPISPLGIHAIKPTTSGTSLRTMHGVAVTPAKAAYDNFPAELVTVVLASSGILSVKVDWTGDLLPGTGIYPPKNVAGTMSADTAPTKPHNILGLYAGMDILPESESGSRISVLILRLAPQISA